MASISCPILRWSLAEQRQCKVSGNALNSLEGWAQASHMNQLAKLHSRLMRLMRLVPRLQTTVRAILPLGEADLMTHLYKKLAVGSVTHPQT